MKEQLTRYVKNHLEGKSQSLEDLAAIRAHLKGHLNRLDLPSLHQLLAEFIDVNKEQVLVALKATQVQIKIKAEQWFENDQWKTIRIDYEQE